MCVDVFIEIITVTYFVLKSVNLLIIVNDLFLRQLNSVDFTDWMGSDVIRYLMESKIESKVQVTSKLSFENRHLLNLETVINMINYNLLPYNIIRFGIIVCVYFSGLIQLCMAG